MTQRTGARTARQDKFAQRRQIVVVVNDLLIQPNNFVLREHVLSGQRKRAAQIEQIILNLQQHCADVWRQLFCKQNTKLAVQLIHAAQHGNAHVVFAYACAVGEAGRAFISGAGGDLG